MMFTLRSAALFACLWADPLMAQQLPAPHSAIEAPQPSPRYAVVDWVPSTLHPDGSFSSTLGPPGTPLFSGAKLTAYFPGWLTLTSDDVIYLSSEITEDLPPMGTPFYFTATHPTMGSYMGTEKVTDTESGDPAWQPWLPSNETVPYQGTIEIGGTYQGFRVAISDLMITDRLEQLTFVACDDIYLVGAALRGRNYTLKTTYLEGNEEAGECVLSGVLQPVGQAYFTVRWGEEGNSCGMSVPTGPCEMELSIEGYERVRVRVNATPSRYAVWHPIIYPDGGSDAPGASDLLPDVNFPATFSHEARIKRLSGEVDFVMGDLGNTLDQNGDGVVDGADLIGGNHLK